MNMLLYILRNISLNSMKNLLNLTKSLLNFTIKADLYKPNLSKASDNLILGKILGNIKNKKYFFSIKPSFGLFSQHTLQIVLRHFLH
jgi:hypothetical protein